MSIEILDRIAEGTRAVAAAAGPAVVTIGRNARGAGVVVAPGQVLTNAHNLRDRSTQVTFSGGRSAQGRVLGVDTDGDLAVLEVDTDDIAPISWSDAPVDLGTPVFALARRGSGLRVTFGAVSAVEQSFRGPRGRRLTGAFEHTAALGRGSSGGPVTDVAGALLGISTSRLGDGFYLAVPADQSLRARVDGLARGEAPRRRQLGVGLAPSAVANRLRRAVGLPERDGLLIQAVMDDGPAQTAGLETGDLIVAVDTVPVVRIDDLLDVIARLEQPTLTLTIVRGVDERTVTVTFPE
jgi:serine protease Do